MNEWEDRQYSQEILYRSVPPDKRPSWWFAVRRFLSKEERESFDARTASRRRAWATWKRMRRPLVKMQTEDTTTDEQLVRNLKKRHRQEGLKLDMYPSKRFMIETAAAALHWLDQEALAESLGFSPSSIPDFDQRLLDSALIKTIQTEHLRQLDAFARRRAAERLDINTPVESSDGSHPGHPSLRRQVS